MKKTYKKLLTALIALVLIAATGLTVLASGEGPADEAAGSAETTYTEESAAMVDESSSEEIVEESPSASEPEETREEPPANIPYEPESSEIMEDVEKADTEETVPENKSTSPQGQALSETSTLVESYEELKNALGDDNGFTTIYLGADITLGSASMPVHSSKSSVVIDGAPPFGKRYTLTQYQASGTNGIILVNNAANTDVTLRNMDIVGKNDYGVVWVDNSITTVTITLENVSYTGPQALHHRNGTVRFIGGRYTLSRGELAEALHAQLGGDLTIAGPSGNSVLWLVSTASTLTVLEGANVRVNTSNYFVYGNIASASLQTNAGLNLVSKRFGFSYGSNTVGTFTLAEGARLNVDLNTTESYAALRVSKHFEMAPGSSATILRRGTAGIPLRLTAANAKAVFNQPRRVFFYSSAGVPLRFLGAGTLSINTTALNIWGNTAWPLASGLDIQPTHIWNKALDEALTLTGSYNTEANNNLTHNLTADDPVTTQLTAKNFDLEHSQLLAFGSGILDIDFLTNTASALTGGADPDASLRADYILADGRGGQIDGAADAAGAYSLPVSGGDLMVGSGVNILLRTGDLFLRKTETVRDANEHRLAFLSVPERINFGAQSVPDSRQIIGRQQADLAISVRDTRLTQSPWRIDATADGWSGALSGAILFVTKDGQRLTLNEVPLTVYRQTDGVNGDIDIQWDSGEGVLLSMVPGEVYSDTDYSATIHWALVEAP